MKKFVKSPKPTINKKTDKLKITKDKHTNCDTFSITIRPGNGLNLGNKTVSEIEQYFESTFDYYIISVEKYGSARHIQGGGFSHSLKRQDNIFSKLRELTVKLFKETEESEGRLSSQKRLDQVAKHGCKVEPHTSFRGLVEYCSKEGFFAVHRYKLPQEDLTFLYDRIYCKEHQNPLSIYHESGVDEDHPFYSCPKCPSLPMYHWPATMMSQDYVYRPAGEEYNTSTLL